MRHLTLSASDDADDERAAAESEYVSLTELHKAADSRGALLVRASGTSGLIPLTSAAATRLARAQDALLVVIVGLCSVLACWACAQVYHGRLCVAGHDCIVPLQSRAFRDRGGPDLLFNGGSFTGGWPLSHSLLHVFLPAVTILYIVAARLQSPSVMNALAWIWLTLVQLSVVIIDTLRLWRWQGPTCARLQTAILASFLPPDVTVTCVTRAYEAFVSVEMVLVVVLLVLTLLEPVLFRLWWGSGCLDQSEDNDEEKPLQQEDAASPHETYRRL